MGGYGSGRWRSHSGRPLAEQSLAWYIGQLRPALAETQRTGEWAHDETRWSRSNQVVGAARVSVRQKRDGAFVAMLQYAAGDEPIADPVMLTTTPCNFGGVRWWWVCPGCGRRCAVLFNPRRYWRCGRCHNVIYESSVDSRRWESLWRDMGYGPEAQWLLRRRWKRA